MKKYIPLALIIAVFIFSSFLSQEYSDFLGESISQYRLAGLIIYAIAVIVAIVAAPLTSIPFIPLMAETYGIFVTATVSVVSWTIGSMAAFWVARKFGVPVAKKFVSITNKKKNFYEHVPEERAFWYLIFLRMVVPVDILSYMLGLFTDIKWKLFAVTTFLGVIPVVLFLSIFGSISFEYQILVSLVGVGFLTLFLVIKKIIKINKKNHE